MSVGLTHFFSRDGKIVIVVFFCLVAAWAALPWTLAYVPSQDGPSHINAAAILRDIVFRQPTRNAEFYMIRPHFFTNLGVDFIAVPLMSQIGPVATEKLIVTLAVILVPMGALAVTTSFVRQPSPAVLLLVPYGYTSTIVLGNYNFILSAALALFIVAAVIRDRPPNASRLRFAAISAALVLAAAIHPAGPILALYFGGVFVLTRELVNPSDPSLPPVTRWRRVLFRYGGMALPTLAILATFFFFSPPSDAAYQRSPYLRVRELIMGWELYKVDRSEIAYCLALGATLVAIAAICLWQRSKRDRATSRADALIMVAIAAFFLYMIAPNKMSGGDAFDARIEMFPLLFFIAWAGCQPMPKGAWTLIFVLALGIDCAFITTAYRVDQRASRDMQAYFQLGELIPPNSLVLPIIGEEHAESGDQHLSEMKAHIYQHLHNDIAVLQSAIFLDNWNAHFSVANIMFKPELDPYRFRDSMPPANELRDYEAATGKHVDYLWLWRLQPGTPSHDQAAALASSDFEAVKVIEGRELTGLYRRRAP